MSTSRETSCITHSTVTVLVKMISKQMNKISFNGILLTVGLLRQSIYKTASSLNVSQLSYYLVKTYRRSAVQMSTSSQISSHKNNVIKFKITKSGSI